MRILIIISIWLCSYAFALNAQDSGEGSFQTAKTCATPAISFQDREDGLKAGRKSVQRNSGMTQLPLRAHIVREDDGSGGLDLEDLNKGLANLNNMYYPANIEWFITEINYIDNSNFYDYDTSEEDAMCVGEEVDDAVNVFFVDRINGGIYCGYAYYPSNSDVSLRIVMDNGCTLNGLNGTFVHEFGHHFSLPHTHQWTQNGNNHPNAEHVPRTGAQSNCLLAGDYICDTEADPRGSTSNCVYNGGGVDIFGNPYTPPVDNVMSYYPDGCGGIFTSGQYTEIGIGLTSRLAHTAYDIDGAVPQSVANPSSLTIVNFGFHIELQWNDNSDNETGFIIERSDDGGSSFKTLAFGGVGPDFTSYEDHTIVSGSAYQYRIKASNDNPDHYSNIATIVTDVCIETDLLFSGGDLISTAVTRNSLPTSIPSCQSSVNTHVKVVGDFGAGFEICDVLGEDNSSVLGQTAQSSSDCTLSGGISSMSISSAQYNNWASDGTMTLYIDGNSQVGDFCGTNTVTICMEILNCGNCPPDYAGPNQLSGSQVVNEDYETDGLIQSNQDIMTGADVIYDSGNAIELLAGFESYMGSVFEAFIDGCGNLFKPDTSGESEK